MSDLVRRITVDHLTLPVANVERSQGFYGAVLASLGFRTVEGDGFTAFGAPGSEDFTIAPGTPSPEGVHVAFAAASREEVDAFHAAALTAGGTDNGAPGLRPRYHAGYYAAYVIDLDGYNVEAVFHDR